LLCSLLFGLLHFPAGAAVVTGGLSLVACLLVLKGGMLAYAFQLHVAWNALSQVNRMGDLSARWFWTVAASVVIAALAAGSLKRPPNSDSAA
jgi:membrane protease YdiL (CAAX protease family)